jgi:hypothetical protein
MSQALQGASFHIEHVRPISKGGATNFGNLALACPTCNLHKTDRVMAEDPMTETSVPLFNPRKDRWRDHFEWSASSVLGLTASGRATITLLRLNAPRRLIIRQAESRFGLFPPP